MKAVNACTTKSLYFPSPVILLTLALLFLLPTHGQAAASLQGKVQKQQLGGEPMANVAISAPEAAGPTATDSFGHFELAFPRLTPGDKIALDIKLTGWVVVNDWQLAGYNLPSTRRDNPLIILLAKPKERDRWAAQYYGIQLSQIPLNEYKRKVAERKTQHKDSAQEIQLLAQERDRALAEVEQLAQELANTRPDEGNTLYQQAYQHLANNRLDEALALLNEEKLRAKVALTEAHTRKIKQETAQQFLLRGRILASRLQFDDAARAYREATQLLPDDPETWFRFATFHQGLNHFTEARQGYERSLLLSSELASSNSDTCRPDVTTILNNIGVLHSNQNRPDQALQAYDEALKIRRDLAHTTPDTYLLDVATTLNNLGNLHDKQNHPDQALRAFDEALKIHRDLARTNPETYRPYVAGTLNNLGILHHKQNRPDQARQAYDEALKIQRDLALSNPDTYRPDMAMTLNNLGILHDSQNRPDQALQAYDEALEIRRDLARSNPDTYRPNVATVQNNLGILHDSQNRPDQALQAYDEALEIRRDLARRDPEAYRPDVATTLNNLGVLHYKQNRPDQARQAFDEAIAIFLDLAKSNPQRFIPEVQRVQENLKILDKAR